MSLTNQAAKIFIDSERTVSEICPLLFSGFAEHMCRCIYKGIHDTQSALADSDGLRTDVIAALRELNYRSIRYLGRNFLGGYQWLDGVGPKNMCPRRRDLALKSKETNRFGTNEFIEFCRKTGTEPMLGLNFGTGAIDEAAALQVLLYGCNCRRNVFQRQVFIYGSCTSCSNSQPAESGGVPPAATGRRAPVS